AAPPFTPNTGPSAGSRRQMTAFLPSWLSASPRPTVVVVLPSPAGVGELAVRFALDLLDRLERDFRFVAAVGLEVVLAEAEFRRDFGDALHFRRLGDLDIAGQR